MYASPVIYPLSRVPERWRSVYMLNPMAGLISSYRRVVLSGKPPVIAHIGPAVLVALALLLLGYHVFKQVEWQFADVI
jgi:lipopolysaccharide transport system permease protein